MSLYTLREHSHDTVTCMTPLALHDTTTAKSRKNLLMLKKPTKNPERLLEQSRNDCKSLTGLMPLSSWNPKHITVTGWEPYTGVELVWLAESWNLKNLKRSGVGAGPVRQPHKRLLLRERDWPVWTCRQACVPLYWLWQTPTCQRKSWAYC